MAFQSKSESAYYGSGSSAAILSEAALDITPSLVEEGLLACGIPVPPGAVKIASGLLLDGAILCATLISSSSVYPCAKSQPTAAETGRARIVLFKVLSRPLKSAGWLSKLNKAAMHWFVFVKCETVKQKEFYMVFEFNEDSKVSMYFVDDDLTSTDYGNHKKYPGVYVAQKTKFPLWMFWSWGYLFTSLVEYDMEKMNCKAFCRHMEHAYEEKKFCWTGGIGWQWQLKIGDEIFDAKKKKVVKGFNDGVKLYKRAKAKIDFGKDLAEFFGIPLPDLAAFFVQSLV